jgi:hypothetical protein
MGELSLEAGMAILTVDSGCPQAVRRVRRLIQDYMGSEAATVFGEAMANVREHGEEARAEIALHRTRFEVRNAAHHAFHAETDKPTGEGGYGLRIMERMGASLDADDRHCSIRWRAPCC